MGRTTVRCKRVAFGNVIQVDVRSKTGYESVWFYLQDVAHWRERHALTYEEITIGLKGSSPLTITMPKGRSGVLTDLLAAYMLTGNEPQDCTFGDDDEF